MTEIIIPTLIFIGVIIGITLLAVVVVGGIVYLFNLSENRRAKYPRLKYRIPVKELYDTIDIIVATETATYEQYLNSTTENNLDAPLTNSQFINIYNDLCKRILKSLSPTFYEMAAVYITADCVNTFITQRVYNYLAARVMNSNTSMKEGVEEDEA